MMGNGSTNRTLDSRQASTDLRKNNNSSDLSERLLKLRKSLDEIDAEYRRAEEIFRKAQEKHDRDLVEIKKTINMIVKEAASRFSSFIQSQINIYSDAKKSEDVEMREFAERQMACIAELMAISNKLNTDKRIIMIDEIIAINPDQEPRVRELLTQLNNAKIEKKSEKQEKPVPDASLKPEKQEKPVPAASSKPEKSAKSSSRRTASKAPRKVISQEIKVNNKFIALLEKELTKLQKKSVEGILVPANDGKEIFVNLQPEYNSLLAIIEMLKEANQSNKPLTFSLGVAYISNELQNEFEELLSNTTFYKKNYEEPRRMAKENEALVSKLENYLRELEGRYNNFPGASIDSVATKDDTLVLREDVALYNNILDIIDILKDTGVNLTSVWNLGNIKRKYNAQFKELAQKSYKALVEVSPSFMEVSAVKQNLSALYDLETMINSLNKDTNADKEELEAYVAKYNILVASIGLAVSRLKKTSDGTLVDKNLIDEYKKANDKLVNIQKAKAQKSIPEYLKLVNLSRVEPKDFIYSPDIVQYAREVVMARLAEIEDSKKEAQKSAEREAFYRDLVDKYLATLRPRVLVKDDVLLSIRQRILSDISRKEQEKKIEAYQEVMRVNEYMNAIFRTPEIVDAITKSVLSRIADIELKRQIQLKEAQRLELVQYLTDAYLKTLKTPAYEREVINKAVDRLVARKSKQEEIEAGLKDIILISDPDEMAKAIANLIGINISSDIEAIIEEARAYDVAGYNMPSVPKRTRKAYNILELPPHKAKVHNAKTVETPAVIELPERISLTEEEKKVKLEEEVKRISTISDPDQMAAEIANLIGINVSSDVDSIIEEAKAYDASGYNTPDVPRRMRARYEVLALPPHKAKDRDAKTIETPAVIELPGRISLTESPTMEVHDEKALETLLSNGEALEDISAVNQFLSGTNVEKVDNSGVFNLSSAETDIEKQIAAILAIEDDAARERAINDFSFANSSVNVRDVQSILDEAREYYSSIYDSVVHGKPSNGAELVSHNIYANSSNKLLALLYSVNPHERERLISELSLFSQDGSVELKQILDKVDKYEAKSVKPKKKLTEGEIAAKLEAILRTENVEEQERMLSSFSVIDDSNNRGIAASDEFDYALLSPAQEEEVVANFDNRRGLKYRLKRLGEIAVTNLRTKWDQIVEEGLKNKSSEMDIFDTTKLFLRDIKSRVQESLDEMTYGDVDNNIQVSSIPGEIINRNSSASTEKVIDNYRYVILELNKYLEMAKKSVDEELSQHPNRLCTAKKARVQDLQLRINLCKEKISLILVRYYEKAMKNNDRETAKRIAAYIFELTYVDLTDYETIEEAMSTISQMMTLTDVELYGELQLKSKIMRKVISEFSVFGIDDKESYYLSVLDNKLRQLQEDRKYSLSDEYWALNYDRGR